MLGSQRNCLKLWTSFQSIQNDSAAMAPPSSTESKKVRQRRAQAVSLSALETSIKLFETS